MLFTWNGRFSLDKGTSIARALVVGQVRNQRLRVYLARYGGGSTSDATIGNTAA